MIFKFNTLIALSHDCDMQTRADFIKRFLTIAKR